MKSIKLIIGIILLAMTSAGFGQFKYIKAKIFRVNEPVLLASYTMEGQADDLETYEAETIVSYHIHSADVDIIYDLEMGLEQPIEESLELESWMSSPFKTQVDSEDIELEAWMYEPFSPAPAEQQLELEEWMSKPFFAQK